MVTYKSHKQSGVFAPLLAAIALALITITFTLGYDVVKVKLATQELQRFADIVCYKTSKNTVIQKTAFENFRQSVAAHLTDHITRSNLRRGELTIPLMPDTGVYDPGGTEGSTVTATVVALPNVTCSGASTNCSLGFNDSGEPRSVTVDTFQVTLGFNRFSSPQHSISPNTGAGATAACEFVAIPRSLWLQTEPKPIVVKSVYHSYIKGLYPVAGAKGRETSGNWHYPGLTIGIVPYMPSDPQDQRYRFRAFVPGALVDSSDSEFYPNSTNDKFLSNYSPLHIFSPSFAPSLSTSSWQTGAAFGYSATSSGSPIATTVGAPTSVNVVAPETPSTGAIYEDRPGFMCSVSTNHCEDKGINPEGPTPPAPAAAELLKLSARDDLLAACLNPPTLLRNIFLSTIIELASRHGQLRGMTEVVVANPRNNSGLNYPSVPVPFGSDIADKKFHLPYLSFNPTNYTPNSQLPQSAAYNSDLSPFSSSASAEKGYQSLIAGQLRNCFHLYKGDGEKRLKRFDLARLNSTFLDNGDFEVDTPYSRYNTGFSSRLDYIPNAVIASGTYSSGDWDQGSDLNSNTLTAAELVSIMGSAQLMPGKPKYQDPAPTPTFFNISPNPGDTDLRGDVVGLLRYWLKGDPSPTADPPFSIPMPGIFPAPFTPDVNTETKNNLSTLLLVLHQRLTSNDAQAIRDLLESRTSLSPRAAPYIIVFYIPTTADDASGQAINDLNFAFDIKDSSYQNTEGRLVSALIVASPSNASAYQQFPSAWSRYAEYIPPSELTYLSFRRYWLDKLMGTDASGDGLLDQDDPVNWGISLFLNYITQPGPRI